MVRLSVEQLRIKLKKKWLNCGRDKLVFEALKSGKRGGRIKMIAAWCSGELLAPFTIAKRCLEQIEGACNRSVFEI